MTSLAFYLFAPTDLMNLTKHEAQHSCKILYVHTDLLKYFLFLFPQNWLFFKEHIEVRNWHDRMPFDVIKQDNACIIPYTVVIKQNNACISFNIIYSSINHKFKAT